MLRSSDESHLTLLLKVATLPCWKSANRSGLAHNSTHVNLGILAVKPMVMRPACQLAVTQIHACATLKHTQCHHTGTHAIAASWL